MAVSFHLIYLLAVFICVESKHERGIDAYAKEKVNSDVFGRDKTTQEIEEDSTNSHEIINKNISASSVEDSSTNAATAGVTDDNTVENDIENKNTTFTSSDLFGNKSSTIESHRATTETDYISTGETRTSQRKTRETTTAEKNTATDTDDTTNADIDSGISTEPQPSPAEPEPETSPTPDGNPFLDAAFAEPTPDWEEAMKVWSIGWYLHVYITGALFALLALYSLYSVCLIRRLFVIGRGYFISLNVILFIFGASRTFYLLFDAYNAEGKLPAWLSYYCMSISFPCLTSAFSILFLALFRTTRMSVMTSVLNVPVLVVTILLHFLLVLSTDFLVGYLSTAVVLLFVCQVVYVVWSVILTLAYLALFARLHGAALVRQKQIKRHSFTEVTISGVQTIKRGASVRLSRAVIITILAAVFGLFCAGLQTISIVLVYAVDSGDPEPWTWWGYQLASRVCELLMCLLLSYVGTRPLYQKDKQYTCCCCCAKKEKVEITENPYWVDNSAHVVADRYYHGGDHVHTHSEDEVPLHTREPLDHLRPVSDISSSAGSSAQTSSRPVSGYGEIVVQFHNHEDGRFTGDGDVNADLSPFGVLPESSAPPWKTNYQKLSIGDRTLKEPVIHFQPESFTEYDRLGYRKPIRLDSDRVNEHTAGLTFGKHRISEKEPLPNNDISKQSTFRSSWTPGTKGYCKLPIGSPDERHVYDKPIISRDGNEVPSQFTVAITGFRNDAVSEAPV